MVMTGCTRICDYQKLKGADVVMLLSQIYILYRKYRYEMYSTLDCFVQVRIFFFYYFNILEKFSGLLVWLSLMIIYIIYDIYYVCNMLVYFQIK